MKASRYQVCPRPSVDQRPSTMRGHTFRQLDQNSFLLSLPKPPQQDTHEQLLNNGWIRITNIELPPSSSVQLDPVIIRANLMTKVTTVPYGHMFYIALTNFSIRNFNVTINIVGACTGNELTLKISLCRA